MTVKMEVCPRRLTDLMPRDASAMRALNQDMQSTMIWSQAAVQA